MRMLLIGASLRPWLGAAGQWQTYPALYVLLTDINWLLALSRNTTPGERDWGIYLGSGILTWAIWSPGRGAGLFRRQPRLRSPEGLRSRRCHAGVLHRPCWCRSGRGNGRRSAGLVAGVAAGLTWYLFGGYWSILTGAIAGAFSGAYLDD
jgi:predicted branched-subunit amino acid permease